MSDATRVAIIGLGVIGGSAALKLIERGVTPTGFSTLREDLDAAEAAGVRIAKSVADAVRDADLIVIAVTLDVLASVAGDVVRAASEHATILHVAGLQRPDATRLPANVAERVIGTHPVAGSEQSGFGAAGADLFREATVYVEERGTRRMREDAELFWSMAGARRIEYLDAVRHDELMAAISHVPQLVATALAASLAYANTPRSRLGPGGRDMTRLAASPWTLWHPILSATPGRTVAILESIETELRAIREAIQRGQLEDPGLTWSVARAWALEASPPGGEVVVTLRVSGTVNVPGDKSISHRALMLAALSEGTSRITAILDSADIRSTASVLRSLGVSIPELSPDFVVKGHGTSALRASASDLDCGNSGTSARLFAGIAAAQSFKLTFTGDASLSRRPMRRVARPLTEMGASIELLPHGGLPMSITGGNLRPLHYFNETSSAQVKSAVLLAAAVAGIPSSVTEPMRSRDHSERMLEARGAHVHFEAMSDGHCVHIGPVDRLHALDVRVPGDPSSAAFFAGLAALASAGQITMPWVCVNPTRDGAMAVLTRMGAGITMADRTESGGETIATIIAAPGSLKATTIGGAEIPTLIDELPLLACVAARAEGTTTITGAAELRVKESDRIATVVANLRAVGVEAEELSDGLRVTGADRPLQGRVVTHGDHRIAMAFGILGSVPGNSIEVDDRDCVGVSYPSFWTDLESAVSL